MRRNGKGLLLFHNVKLSPVQVGSAAVRALKDGSGDVEIYVPSYELSQVNIFRLSNCES